METEGVTTISREPAAFWLGVLRGRQKSRVGFSSPDPFEERLWDLGYKMGRTGALKSNDEMAYSAIIALAREPSGWASFVRGVSVGVICCSLVFLILAR